jgi:hypothetical protein
MLSIKLGTMFHRETGFEAKIRKVGNYSSVCWNGPWASDNNSRNEPAQWMGWIGGKPIGFFKKKDLIKRNIGHLQYNPSLNTHRVQKRRVDSV